MAVKPATSQKWHFDKYLILEEEGRRKRAALRWVFVGGFLVGLLKATAYFLTGSNAILSDVLESVINMAATAFSLYSLAYAARPRDAKQPYGYGKMETLAATVQGTLIGAAGASILAKAIYNLIKPHEVEGVDIGILFIVGAAAANFILGQFLLAKARKFNSPVLGADGKRILSDAYSSGILVVGLFIILASKRFVSDPSWIDSVIAILSGILLLRTAYGIITKSVKGLLDAADPETLNEAMNVLGNSNRPAWIDFEDLRATSYGMYKYLDCRMTLPWYWELQQVSREVKDAEFMINQHFKERVELFVQAEPCQPRHCPRCRLEGCPVRQAPYRKGRLDKIGDGAAGLAPVEGSTV